MSDSYADVEELIQKWWDICSRPAISEHEILVNNRDAFACGKELGEYLSQHEADLINSSNPRAPARLNLDLRSLVTEAVNSRILSSDQERQFRDMLASLLPAAVGIVLKTTFDAEWEFTAKLIAAHDSLLRKGLPRIAGEFARSVLHCVGRWHTTQDEFKSRLILHLLSGQLYWDIKGVLLAIDTSIIDHWKYEQRENGSSYQVAVSPNERFALRPRHEFHYKDVELSFDIEEIPSGRKLAVEKWYHALKWTGDSALWMVIDGWIPLNIDLATWTFSPDSRVFTRAESQVYDLDSLNQWLEERMAQRTSRH